MNSTISDLDYHMHNVCDKVLTIVENSKNDYVHRDSIIKLSGYKDYEVVAALYILRDKIRNPYGAKMYQEAVLYRLRSKGLTKAEKRRKKKNEILRMIANDG